jgi:hypothetical protein
MMDERWYVENKLMLWLMHCMFAVIIPLSASSGKFLLLLWQFLTYLWFIRAMEWSELSFRANLCLREAVDVMHEHYEKMTTR